MEKVFAIVGIQGIRSIIQRSLKESSRCLIAGIHKTHFVVLFMLFLCSVADIFYSLNANTKLAAVGNFSGMPIVGAHQVASCLVFCSGRLEAISSEIGLSDQSYEI